LDASTIMPCAVNFGKTYMTGLRRKLQKDTSYRISGFLQKVTDTIHRNLMKVARISVGVILFGWSENVDQGTAKFGASPVPKTCCSIPIFCHPRVLLGWGDSLAHFLHVRKNIMRC
jgi:hypothetical protein